MNQRRPGEGRPTGLEITDPRDLTPEREYALTQWVDGAGKLHVVADFGLGLGNSGEAERVLNNAAAAARRRVWNHRGGRSKIRGYRPRLIVVANQQDPSLNTTTRIEWLEEWR